MAILLTVIHVVVCFFLVIVVLLQSGKAADLAGAFGGMGSQTAFGPRGSATLLSKATTLAAALFMLTSLTLSIITTRGAGVSPTVLERVPEQSQSAPGQPAAPSVQTDPNAPAQPLFDSTPGTDQPAEQTPAN
ncbi:MAG: preprotein translocase subunit SecG [Bryobacteraceae bacterium]